MWSRDGRAAYIIIIVDEDEVNDVPIDPAKIVPAGTVPELPWARLHWEDT
jgi:hypothetical protein